MVEILSYQSTFQKATLSARKLYFPNVHLALTKIWQTGFFHSVSVDFFEVAPRLKLGFCGWSSYDIGAGKFPKPSPWFSGTTCEVSPPTSSVRESSIVFLRKFVVWWETLEGRSKILGRDWPFQNKEIRRNWDQLDWTKLLIQFPKTGFTFSPKIISYKSFDFNYKYRKLLIK